MKIARNAYARAPREDGKIDQTSSVKSRLDKQGGGDLIHTTLGGTLNTVDNMPAKLSRVSYRSSLLFFMPKLEMLVFSFRKRSAWPNQRVGR